MAEPKPPTRGRADVVFKCISCRYETAKNGLPICTRRTCVTRFDSIPQSSRDTFSIQYGKIRMSYLKTLTKPKAQYNIRYMHDQFCCVVKCADDARNEFNLAMESTNYVEPEPQKPETDGDTNMDEENDKPYLDNLEHATPIVPPVASIDTGFPMRP